MKTKKLTPPANAPKIPKGWVYKGKAWMSGKSVRYAFWSDGLGWDEWFGLPSGHEGETWGFADRHYITPATKPKNPAPAKAKRAGKPVKAVKVFANYFEGNIQRTARTGFTMGCNIPVFVLPADAASVAKMVEQITRAHYGAGLKLLSKEEQESWRDVARRSLAAIGIAGRRK